MHQPLVLAQGKVSRLATKQEYAAKEEGVWPHSPTVLVDPVVNHRVPAIAKGPPRSAYPNARVCVSNRSFDRTVSGPLPLMRQCSLLDVSVALGNGTLRPTTDATEEPGDLGKRLPSTRSPFAV